MTGNLFDTFDAEMRREQLGPGATVLRQFAVPEETALLSGLEDVIVKAPFRHMTTPGGFRMSVAMTNCGPLGWVSDSTGYRYETTDPVSGLRWPQMPDAFRRLASSAATDAGFSRFIPDACLINRYEPGARLTLHQDRDERDYAHPIVSVSLGVPAAFQFGGPKRRDPVRKIVVRHGDVVVWGGVSRLAYHGLAALKSGEHPLLGNQRINLTFRRAL